MRYSSFRVAAAALAFLIVPASAVPAQGADPAADVRAAMSGFMDALNALDTERMSSCFADDVTAFVPSAKAEYVDGKPALTAVFRGFVEHVKATLPALHLVPEDERVEVSGDLAVVTFQIREQVPKITRRRTFVFRRTNGHWLISHFHASDLVPPAR